MAEGIGLTFVGGLVLAFMSLGLRILLRAPSEGGAPDRLIALFFMSQGLSYGLYPFGGAAAGTFLGVVVTLSACALLEFTRRVFRPEDGWALALSLVITAAIGLAFIAPSLSGSISTETRLVAAALRSAGYLWPLVECALYYRAMKRRMRLGLAEPVLANRFLLWSLWTAGAVAVPLGGAVVRVMALLGSGKDPTIGIDHTDPTTLVLFAWTAAWMITAISALWLSFFPSARYVAYLNTRASRDAARSGGGAAGAPA